MTTDVLVPITPELLTYFIEDGCIDRLKLAERVGTLLNDGLPSPDYQPADIADLENGVRQPTRDEWRALATALRRPTAAFLLPSPPDPVEMNALDQAEQDIWQAIEDLLLVTLRHALVGRRS
jgi:hypothetical protein